jgi:hypothetical protein
LTMNTPSRNSKRYCSTSPSMGLRDGHKKR